MSSARGGGDCGVGLWTSMTINLKFVQLKGPDDKDTNSDINQYLVSFERALHIKIMIDP